MLRQQMWLKCRIYNFTGFLWPVFCDQFWPIFFFATVLHYLSKLTSKPPPYKPNISLKTWCAYWICPTRGRYNAKTSLVKVPTRFIRVYQYLSVIIYHLFIVYLSSIYREFIAHSSLDLSNLLCYFYSQLLIFQFFALFYINFVSNCATDFKSDYKSHPYAEILHFFTVANWNL